MHRDQSSVYSMPQSNKFITLWHTVNTGLVRVVLCFSLFYSLFQYIIGDGILLGWSCVLMYYHRFRINTTFQPKIVNIFLPINLSICFGCSKEPSH